MPTPKAGVAYTFTISLYDVANPGRLKTTPTLAAGDFKVSVNGGSLANLATLPSETPAGSGLVVVSLAAGEVGTKTTVRWSDADFEWSDGSYFFDAPTATIEDVAQPGDAMALTSGERTTLAGVLWATLTSALTTVGSIGKLLVDNVNATISSRLASSSYTAPLDAAGTRSAVGLASANLDTQLAPLTNLDATVSSRLASASYTAPDNADIGAIKAKTDLLPSSPAATGDAMTLTSGERDAIGIALMVLTSTAWEGSAPAKSLGTAIMKAVHKTLDNHGTLEIYRADGTTLHATQAETTDVTAAPLVGLSGAS